MAAPQSSEPDKGCYSLFIKTDNDEAFMEDKQLFVQQLLMVKPTKWLYWFDRRGNLWCETGLAPLSGANGVKKLCDWISEDGCMTAKFINIVSH